MAATNAMIAPTPGAVISRRRAGSWRACTSSNLSSRAICSDHAEKAAAMATNSVAPSVSASGLGKKRLMPLTPPVSKSSPR